MKYIWGIAGILAGLLFIQTAPAAEWSLDRGASSLGFVAAYDEIPFEGRFGEFDARIRFDPGEPTDGSFMVNIDLASVDTNSPDRDEGMLESEWFDTDRHPLATFTSTSFERMPEDNRFTVTGDLTIKDITKSVTAEFLWVETNTVAHLNGSTDVRRDDFNIGSGDWAEDDTIAFDVRIVFDLTLNQ